MSRIIWDQTGERVYETGITNGVLYVASGIGYGAGIPWNGITAVTESPSGAEATPLYADDIKYLNLISAEEFGATVEAYTYPDEFAECDGSAAPTPGMTIGQQNRKRFGLVYKTTVGNDTQNNAYGYKLHIIYGATAAPSEKAYATINDSPEAIIFSWELSTVPVEIGTINGVSYKPTASITIDSTKFSATPATGQGDLDNLTALEDILFGRNAGGSVTALVSSLPTPAQVYEVLTTGAIAVAP